MTAVPAADSSTPLGRRERKKRATQLALETAALRLFQERGFAATTIEDITDEADVGSRTFFRYFASKDDLVLSGHEERLEAFRTALARRPPEEDLLTAARSAIAERADALVAEDGLRLRWRLASEIPSIWVRVLGQQAAAADPLAETIADRLDIAADSVRARVIALSLIMAIRVAIIRWTELPDGKATLAEIAQEALAVLEDGFG